MTYDVTEKTFLKVKRSAHKKGWPRAWIGLLKCELGTTIMHIVRHLKYFMILNSLMIIYIIMVR